MTSQEARGYFSDYVEGALDPDTKDRVQSYLTAHPDAAAEMIEFQRVLSIVHRVPPHEPVLDLWGEFAPKLAEFQAERKLDPAKRMETQLAGFRSNLSAGVILYTHALAAQARNRLERYLMHDSFQDMEQE
ncbi:MAG: anti-sigma factor family protein [Capsulimonadaceae bacterium]